jgi:hypothetical protein
VKTLLLLLLAAVAVAFVFYAGFGIGYQRGAANTFDAKDYDKYRELAFDAHVIARGRQDIYFRGVDSVMMNFPDLLRIETRLGISDEQRKTTERLLIQYFYSQGRQIPPELLPFLSAIPPRETFVFTRLPSRERIQSLRSDEK